MGVSTTSRRSKRARDWAPSPRPAAPSCARRAAAIIGAMKRVPYWRHHVSSACASADVKSSNSPPLLPRPLPPPSAGSPPTLRTLRTLRAPLSMLAPPPAATEPVPAASAAAPPRLGAGCTVREKSCAAQTGSAPATAAAPPSSPAAAAAAAPAQAASTACTMFSSDAVLDALPPSSARPACRHAT